MVGCDLLLKHWGGHATSCHWVELEVFSFLGKMCFKFWLEWNV
jgi:hypothetical protein